jgi:phospholipase C
MADLGVTDAAANPPDALMTGPQLDGGAPDLAQAPSCPNSPASDPREPQRRACAFAAGARVADTLGVRPSKIPVTHLVIITQENRSFDHYYGRLHLNGQPAAEGPPASFNNPDNSGNMVFPQHLAKPCLDADPPHQGDAMAAGWDGGKMDGFVKSAASAGGDGHFVMNYYDETDLPFYYWLANTFAIADRYFGAALGGTWANRDFLYAGTSDGVRDTGERTISVPNIFNALDAAKVGWGVYSDGDPRQDCLGWSKPHAGFADFNHFLSALADGSLPQVTFVDPGPTQDEHPTADIHHGEQWMHQIYEAALASPLWNELAIVLTYDEAGGMADHVPPPAACPPSASQASFNTHGIRIPAIVISPWARRHYVSHVVHDHTSLLRLIELIHDLPALTARDANADAMLDLFDFACPPELTPPPAPNAGQTGLFGCFL